MKPRAVHDRFLLVCRFCGEPILVYAHIHCPLHGVLELYEVLTRVEFRKKELHDLR